MRNYPRPSRIYPVSRRIYPVINTGEAFYFSPGGRKQALLNETLMPFADLRIDPGVDVASAAHQGPDASAFTSISAGSHADLVEAMRFVTYTPTGFVSGAQWQARITDASGNQLTKTAMVDVLVSIPTKRIHCVTGQTVRPFATASYAATQSNISTVQYSISGAVSVAKTAVERFEVVTGIHTASSGSSVLVHSGMDFLSATVYTGMWLANTTDGSETQIGGILSTVNPNDTLSGTLSGGTDNDWDTSDSYAVYPDNDLSTRPNSWEYTPATAGTYIVRLFVHDGTNEFEDVTYLEVANSMGDLA